MERSGNGEIAFALYGIPKVEREQDRVCWKIRIHCFLGLYLRMYIVRKETFLVLFFCAPDEFSVPPFRC